MLLALRCPTCGTESVPDAQFCDACGASLTARPGDGAAGARKVVTIVFADLVGSTSLHERLDAESARRMMDRYYGALRAVVEAHGGTVVKLLGDGVMAAFGVPSVAEDDAIRAVRAAVAMQRGLRAVADDQPAMDAVGLRVAVNTGEVVVSHDHTDVVGDPVNVAARLQQEAHDGDVLVGEETRRLVGRLVTLAPFGALTLKGRSEKVAAYRVVSLDPPAGAPTTAFVGREDELRRILVVHDAALAARDARLVVVLGSPGLGKSRLLDEFTRRLGDRAIVLTLRCDPAGGPTFAPLADGLRALLRIDAGGEGVRATIEAAVTPDDPDRARITDGVAALLAGTPALPEETFFVVRRFLASLGAGRPVVLAIDDLQWAEPLLLDLTEHLVQWTADRPLLVLGTARPELRDTRSSLATPGALVADVVTLAGLDAGAATRLAANVIGADALPAAVAGRVLAASEGNPLFVGELVRMLVHDGALRREGDRWTAGAELARLEMPPTIHAVVAARIERLRPEDRIVLERAAVVGRQFSRAAVAHLLPREVTDLDARLDSLRRSELVEPDAGWFLGEPSLRFHHVLIRDAAYRRLLKGTRAELHERFAEWLETRGAGAVEHDETVGWHLEQAHQHLRELGPIDEHGRGLGERAARHLAAAGRRALARDDVRVAASLLGRALDRLDVADPARAELALDWCEALLAAGDVGPAARALAELGRFTGGSDRFRAWHACFAGQLAALTDPTSLRAAAESVGAAAEVLAAAGDTTGEAKAYSVHALVLGQLGRIGACETALDRALAAARRAGDRRRANAVLAGAPLAALWGPSPVTRASGRCLDVVRVLRITEGTPWVEAVALRCQAVLEALRGRTDAARRMIATARRMLEDLGMTHQLLEADVFAGLVHLLEGDAAAAERSLSGAYEGLRTHGLGTDAAQAAAYLGRALLAQGRAAEAERLTGESEALAGDDLQAAIAWRGVRAEALARRGEHAAAIDFARAAVDFAAATDALLHHANARLALATALRAAGRSAEADAEERRALELWEAKGATLLAERAGGMVRALPVGRTHEEHAPSVRRRVRPNAATANLDRFDAAIAARDLGALVALLGDEFQYRTMSGIEVGREAASRRFAALLRAHDLRVLREVLATLGESLALCRTTLSLRALADDDIAPFGESRSDSIIVVEVDRSGLQRWVEGFTETQLAAAVTRLYERHGELLPHGPDRTRTEATARAIATLARFPGPDDLGTVFAPDVALIDHRRAGLGSARGVQAYLRGLRALIDIADDVATRFDDVLVLRADRLLVRSTNFGTHRAGGGAFERPMTQILVFGTDGLVARFETFDADRDDAALSRFDELAMQAPRRLRPIVRRNAACEVVGRLDAAVAARDAGALVSLFADVIEVVEHPTGAVFDGRGLLTGWRGFLRAENAVFKHELLATLGDALALSHGWMSFTALADDVATFGAVDREEYVLVEVDAHRQFRRVELFAPDRLGDAVARLYARHAELLPEGPDRVRAAGTGRTVAAMAGPADLDRWASVFAPAIEFNDPRNVGLGSVSGSEALVRGIRALFELSDDFRTCLDEILALRPDALLLRWKHTGTDRASGGPFERNLCHLWTFGADGRLARWEQTDDDRAGEALARFAALTAEPVTTGLATAATRIENAATRCMDRFAGAWAARDWNVASIYALGFRLIDRRSIVHLDLDGEQHLRALRPMFDMESSRFTLDPIATRGDRLALARARFESSGRSVGPSENEWLQIIGVDVRGDCAEMVMFDSGDLDAAHVELDRRFAVGEAAGHGPVAAAMRGFTDAFARRDWSVLAARFAPDLVVHDRRRLGWETLRGPAAYVDTLRSLVELAPDVRLRVDHVRMSDRALLWVAAWQGSREGGSFETPWIIVSEHDALGRVRRFDQYDLDQLDAALARLAALHPDAAPIPPNAATRASDRWVQLSEAHDWKALEALCAATCHFEDRRRGILVTGGRDTLLASTRLISSMGVRLSRTLLATAGDRLSLERILFIGPADRFEVEALQVVEVDAQGRIVAVVGFDADDRCAASTELSRRFERSG
jgi:class 3 adenylate cyclase/tetratricopeptide (TPR) repeat protein